MNQPFRNLDEVQLWLDAHTNYELWATPHNERPTPTLDGVRQLLDLLGNPQESLTIVHITGTNGKTSTSRMVARMLGEYGLTTGLFTSPHLQRLNERWQLNLQPVDDGPLTDVFTLVANAESLVEKDDFTVFELITAAAFVLFADAAVDVVVLEVGIGGRWDCTNIADGDVSVITNVSLDHMNELGPTRELIAGEKAGIIKEKSAVILGENDPELREIFTKHKAESFQVLGEEFSVSRNDLAVGGRIIDAQINGQNFEELFISLHGPHQGVNAAIALAAVRAFFNRDLDEEIVRAALSDVNSPGRLEIMNREPLVLLDGAHNTAGALALVDALEEEFGVTDNLIIVFGMLKGHEPDEFFAELTQLKPKLIICTQADSPRAYAAEELTQNANEYFPTAEFQTITRVSDAIKYAQKIAFDDDVVVICGSLYAVGEAREQFLPASSPISE